MPTITVYEVGPRDGLQNEAATVATADKIAFVDRLSAAGLPAVEVARVRQPEMGAADGGRRRGVRRHPPPPGTRYSALVPNLNGLERALDGRRHRRRRVRRRVRDVQPAQHQPVDRRSRSRPIAALRGAPLDAGLRVRGYLSTAFGCPFEGDVPVAARRRVSLSALLDIGVYEVAVSDTIGIAHPGQVRKVLDRAR